MKNYYIALGTGCLFVVFVMFVSDWHSYPIELTAPVPLEKRLKILQQQIDQNNRRTMIHHFEITALNGIEDRITDVDKDVDVCHQRLDDLAKIMLTWGHKLPERKRPD